MADGIPARLTLSRRREWLLRICLLGASLLFGLAMAEGMVRAFFPLYDGRQNVDLRGKTITDWFTPGSVYRQISNEYDAVTTITGKGHRVPGTDGNPDVIFLGDSFTYGYGLADDETFAGIYCSRQQVACANLGMPGSGTSRQVKRLQQFIETWHWRPKEVKLFFFGMSGSFSAGNDFVDNFGYSRWLEGQARGVPARREAPRPSFASRVISSQTSLLEHSYLMRRVKYHWGPLLKSMLVVDPDEDQMARALVDTQRGFQELDDLSRKAGFDYSVYLIVPVQDIIRGSYPETLLALNGVSTKPVATTAPLFVDDPAKFYYAYDGHLNPEGSRRVAEYLISLDRDAQR